MLNYDSRSGLPNSTVRCICETRDGFLWLGTLAGLVRFDGVNYTHFDRWNTPVLQHDRIQALFEDREGRLWIGTAGAGLCVYENGVWRAFRVADGLSNDHVRAVAQDRAGYLWVGTDYGLNRKGAEGFDVFTTKDGLLDNLITDVSVDLHGTVWIATMRGGVSRWKNLHMRSYGPQDGLMNTQVFTIQPDSLGYVWAGTRAGAFVLSPRSGRFTRIAGTSFTPVTAFWPIGQSDMLIATMADGIKRYNGVLSAGPPLPDDHVNDLLLDRLDRLWAGTQTAGLIQWRERAVENLTVDAGSETGVPTAVIEDIEARLWIGSKDHGLYTAAGKTIRPFPGARERLSASTITSLAADSSGTVWVATAGRGVAGISGRSVTWLTSQQGLPSDNVTSVYCCPADRVWIGTDAGLCYYQGGKIVPDTLLADSLAAPVRVLHTAGNENMFVGTGNGLYLLSAGGAEKIMPGEINALCAANDTVLYVGTNGDGLIWLAGGRKKACTTQNGLLDNFISGIYRTAAGDLWLGTPRGIMRLDAEQLTRFFQADSIRLLPALFDRSAGMADSRCSGYGTSAVCAGDSLLYFPTAGGLVGIAGDGTAAGRDGPKVFIHESRAGGRKFFMPQKLAIKKGEQISFHFTATSSRVPELLRFRFRLRGFEKSFRMIFPGEPRTAVYNRLKPGSYTFEVHAVNAAGVLSDSADVVPLKVKAPFFTPLRMLVVLVVFLGLALYTVQRKKKSNKYRTSSLDPGRTQQTREALVRYIRSSKAYLDPDLTLAQLARAVKVHPNHLSQVINGQFGVGFNDFINGYRIEEAKWLLCDPAQQDKNMLQIMLDAGFYSKSVFNTVFKKRTGLTPSQFRKNNNVLPGKRE